MQIELNVLHGMNIKTSLNTLIKQKSSQKLPHIKHDCDDCLKIHKMQVNDQ